MTRQDKIQWERQVGLDQDVIDFEALSANERWSIYWGFLWRQLVLTAAGVIAGVVFSLLSGFLIVSVGEALGHNSRPFNPYTALSPC